MTTVMGASFAMMSQLTSVEAVHHLAATLSTLTALTEFPAVSRGSWSALAPPLQQNWAGLPLEAPHGRSLFVHAVSS